MEQQHAYLMQGEGADAEGGQLHGVQQGDLDHTVGLRSSAGPVLVALHLHSGARSHSVTVVQWINY